MQTGQSGTTSSRGARGDGGVSIRRRGARDGDVPGVLGEASWEAEGVDGEDSVSGGANSSWRLTPRAGIILLLLLLLLLVLLLLLLLVLLLLVVLLLLLLLLLLLSILLKPLN